jgi:hypothetical protein
MWGRVLLAATMAGAMQLAGVSGAHGQAARTLIGTTPEGGNLTGGEDPRLVVPRPRFVAAAGMGATFEPVGFDGGARAVPAFFATGGVGDGRFGFDFQAFASAATGRERQADPIDRVALDAFGVWRPAGGYRTDDRRWRMRLLRTLGVEVGMGLERTGRTTTAGSRFTVHTGARVELPLSPANEPSELRLRFGVRRSFGLYTPRLASSTAGDVTEVGDTAAEVYAAVVVVF